MKTPCLVTFNAATTVVALDLWRVVGVLRIRPNGPGGVGTGDPRTVLMLDGGLQQGLRVYPVDEDVSVTFGRVQEAWAEAGGEPGLWLNYADAEGEAVYIRADYLMAVTPTMIDYPPDEQYPAGRREPGLAVHLVGALNPMQVRGIVPDSVGAWTEALHAIQVGPLTGAIMLAPAGIRFPPLPPRQP